MQAKIKISATIYKTRRIKGQSLQHYDAECQNMEEFKQKIFDQYKSDIAGIVRLDKIGNEIIPVVDTETVKTIDNVGDYIQWTTNGKQTCNLKLLTEAQYEEIARLENLVLRVLKYGPAIQKENLSILEKDTANELNRAGAPTETEQSLMIKALKERHGQLLVPINNLEMAWAIWASHVLQQKTQQTKVRW